MEHIGRRQQQPRAANGVQSLAVAKLSLAFLGSLLSTAKWIQLIQGRSAGKTYLFGVGGRGEINDLKRE